MTFKCTGSHGGLNVEGALEHSCNIFFYNTSQRLGIDLMNKYGKMFGLGQKTGVEIPESKALSTEKSSIWFGDLAIPFSVLSDSPITF